MIVTKSCMHNQAYARLRKKMESLSQPYIIDQFVQKTSHYRYLKYEREVVYDIRLEAKTEDKYLSAIVGSVIVRYAFLKASDAMREQYGSIFLKGAGNKVDQNIHELVAMHGKGVLSQVAKLHFANTKKALG